MTLNIEKMQKKCNTCNKSQNIIYFMQYDEDNIIIINDNCYKCDELIRIGKVCCKCKIPKLLEKFTTNKNALDGTNSTCRECYIEYKKEYNKTHNIEIAKYAQEYYNLHPEKKSSYKGYDPNNYIKYKDYFDNYAKKKHLAKKNDINMNQQLISV
jgi:hypothetical protein